jgi:hypothetical protein
MMPKRVLDFDAMWGSDKLASCAEWAQAEYAWLYGLADASGSFELTNLRVIWGRVAAIRHNLTIERLEQIFDEFHEKGLLFRWEENGKRYGHWTGSDVPGRLPPPSWRMRLEKLAPPVPKQQLAEFMSRFARGRACSPGGGFQSAASDPFRASVNQGFEEAQAQDWDRNKKRVGNVSAAPARAGEEASRESYPLFLNQSEITDNANPKMNQTSACAPKDVESAEELMVSQNMPTQASPRKWDQAWQRRAQDKSAAAAREVRVGQGPSCGNVRVKSEALERVRARDELRAAGGGGTRAP